MLIVALKRNDTIFSAAKIFFENYYQKFTKPLRRVSGDEIFLKYSTLLTDY